MSAPILGLYGIQDHGAFAGPRWTHDHSMALMSDGRVDWALELERYTRRKHDNRLSHYIEELSGLLSIPLDGLRVVCADSFAGRAFVSATGAWRFEADATDLRSCPLLRRGRGWINRREVETWYVFHEVAHIASNLPFCSEFEDNSLLVHIDGGASQSNASVFAYRAGRIEPLYASWETAPVVLNFGYNDLTHGILGLDEETRMAAPGRLMGLAAYGRPSPELREWLMRHDWFRSHWEEPQKFIDAARADLGWTGDTLPGPRDALAADIAACCQAELEDTMFALIERYQVSTGARHLYLGGGVALNVHLNLRLASSGLFDSVHVPPCTSDCGLALGAAALLSMEDRGRVELSSPFLIGLGWTVPTGWGQAFNVSEIAARLARGQVVGLCVGAAEVGPRALGHRSLLASPTSVERRVHMSETVKQREWYRPLAPVVAEELAEQLFPGSASSGLARFMLGAFPVAQEWRARVPAIVHADGTARVQVVRRRDPDHAQLLELLGILWSEYGIPCLVNTSFNGPGEPIVQTADDALATAQRLGIDALVLGDRMMTWSPVEHERP